MLLFTTDVDEADSPVRTTFVVVCWHSTHMTLLEMGKGGHSYAPCLPYDSQTSHIPPPDASDSSILALKLRISEGKGFLRMVFVVVPRLS